MVDKDKKFSIGEGDDIEKNIKKLQRELDDMLLKGAPGIKKEGIEEVKRVKLEEVEEKEKKTKVETGKIYTPQYDSRGSYTSEERFALFKNTKFYIVVFGIIAFGFTLIKAPVFRYTTPMRQDNDIPGIEIGFRYYNNLFGQQLKSETVIAIGQERIVVPISMERWVNLEKEKKFTAIDYYRKK